MHHFFADEKLINGDIVILNENDDKETFNHLKVLRLNINEKVLISKIPYKQDESFISEVIEIDKNSFKFKIIGKDKKRELRRRINLYMGLIKKDNFEFVVEKAVELGVYSIIPVFMEYSKSNFISSSLNKYKSESNNRVLLSNKDLNRLNQISKTASTQSNRSYIPEVTNLISFDDMCDKLNEGFYNVLFYENKEGVLETKDFLLNLQNDVSNKDINIIIGPEGGFSDKEIDKLNKNNIYSLSLGDRILRAETAAIAAISMISIYV